MVFIKINRIRIKDFGSIKDTDWLEIKDNLTVVVGKNATGKSTFINALEFFNLIDKPLPDSSLPNRVEEPQPTFQIELELNSEDLSLFNNIMYNRTYNNNNIIYEKNLIEISKNYSSKDKTYSYKINKEIGFESFEKIIIYIKPLIEKIMRYDVKFQPNFFKELEYQFKEKNTNSVISMLDDLIIRINEKRPHLKFTKIGLNKLFESLNSLKKFAIQGFTTDNIANICANFIPIFIKFNSNEFGILPNRIKYEKKEMENCGIFKDLIKIMNLTCDDFLHKRGRVQKISQMVLNKLNTLRDYILENWTQNKLEFMPYFQADALFPHIKEKNDILEMSQHSSGEIWFISFLIFLFARLKEFKDNRNIVILIDEPCINLHPDAQKNFINILENILINNKNLSIIYTTHSPYLIQSNKLNRVLRITKDENNRTKINSISSKELYEIYSDLGISPTDFLMHSNFIFVEGPKDIKFFERLLDSLVLEKNVKILQMFSKNNIRFANEDLISSLIKQKLKFLIILDKDEGNEKIIDELPNIIKNNVKKLPVRELENLQINPKVISRILVDKYPEKFPDIKTTQEYIANLITNSINENIIKKTTIKTFLERQPMKYTIVDKKYLVNMRNNENWINKFLSYFQKKYKIEHFDSNYYINLFNEINYEINNNISKEDNWKIFLGKELKKSFIELLKKEKSIQINFDNKMIDYMKEDEFTQEFISKIRDHFE